MSDEPSNKPTALEERGEDAGRLFSPSVARNREPILSVVEQIIPRTGRFLEIASGTGEHIAHFAKTFPHIEWVASDTDERAQRSIDAWRRSSGLSNLSGPLVIDARKPQWDIENAPPFDGIVCINMIHIAPFSAVEGLFAGAKRVLASKGVLFLYGPFSRSGAHTAPSNAQFDASLKSRDPQWGVRDLDLEIAPLAQSYGLDLETITTMPANNLSVVFRKSR
ncbi:MAG: DUF938 domain-containing protein [Pseudomonadota bacterium]